MLDLDSRFGLGEELLFFGEEAGLGGFVQVNFRVGAAAGRLENDPVIARDGWIIKVRRFDLLHHLQGLVAFPLQV